MKIQDKFALYMFFSIILFLIVFSSLSYMYNKNATIDSAMHLMQESVSEESSHFGDRLVEKSKIAISIASSDTLLRELVKSNAEYEKLTDEARREQIQDLDSRWKNVTNTEDAFIKAYMNNSMASLLRRQQGALSGEVADIFVTNRYGLAIGATNKPSTLAHDYKYWWQAANNNGQGKIFFDDRGYDESVDDYVIGIVIPIKVNNQVIGILKCNFNLLSIINEYLSSINHDGGHKAMLVRSSGRVVLGEGEIPLGVMLPDVMVNKLDPSSSGSMMINKNNIEHIASYSPVALTFSSEEYGFGGRYKYADAVSSDMPNGWFMLFMTDIDSVLSPAIESVSWFVYSGLVFAFMAGIVALLMGRRLAKPIGDLTERAKRIGQGHLDEVINYVASDELGVLAKAFNDMSCNLREAQTELIRKNRLATLGQLTATVSHELRNPLGAMRPSIYIIEKRSDKDDERVQQAIERIDRNIDRCDHIIDELLDFTRITDLDLHLTHIDEWLESVIDEQDVPKDIRIEKNFSLNGLELAIDTARMQRAVINVFENACHAMMVDERIDEVRKGSCLCIKTVENEGCIKIIISDNGAGISSDILGKIFEPLFSTRAFGVGLGMPTIKQIMEQHGGGIEVNSDEGKGTAVTLWLPNSINGASEDADS